MPQISIRDVDIYVQRCDLEVLDTKENAELDQTGEDRQAVPDRDSWLTFNITTLWEIPVILLKQLVSEGPGSRSRQIITAPQI